MLNLDAITLVDVSDAELAAIEASSGKGAKAIYPPNIAALLSKCDGRTVTASFAAPWAELNADAKSRKQVITGFKQSTRAMKVHDRVKIHPNADDAMVTIIVKPATPATPAKADAAK